MNNDLDTILSSAIDSLRNGNSQEDVIQRLSKDIRRVSAPIKNEKRKYLKKGYYDRLLLKMLTGVRASPSRKEFVELLLDSIRSEKVDAPGDFYILLEGRTKRDGTLIDSKIKEIIGGHKHQVENQISLYERLSKDSLIAAELFVQKRPVSFYLFDSTNEFVNAEDQEVYSSEFSALHGKAPIWICAIPLLSNSASHPHQALVVLYKTKLSGLSYLFPRGATQEWKLFEALPSVWSMLNHQLSTVAEKVDQERKNLVMELAPGAINHEVGAGLQMIQDCITRTVEPSKTVSANINKGLAEFKIILQQLVLISRYARRGKRIADAFNNLEKRNASTKLNLVSVIEEVAIVLEHKLEKNLIKFDWEDVPEIIIESDSALIEHVVINVIINACDAISEVNPEVLSPGYKWNIKISAYEIDGMVSMHIANDGPEIPKDLKPLIFQKGITSKPHGTGHGQGLYICKLVAGYLNGSFGFGKISTFENMTTCFKFDFPKTSQIEEEVLSYLDEEIEIYE